jgi:hypothetical protein
MKRISSLLKKRARAEIAQAVRRTVGHRNPFAIQVGAAEKYPAAMTCASRRMTLSASPFRGTLIEVRRIGQ